MIPTTKHILFLMMALVLLLTACAPAPAATQDPALIQQLVDQALTAAAQNAPTAQPQVIEPSPAPTQAAGPVDTLPDVPDSTTPAPETEPAAPDATETATSEICASSGDTPTPELPTQLKVGDTATIQRPVNLRTQPSLRNRIILTLKPGAQVEILAGPFQQTFAAGGEYLWWQVKLPGGLIGWSAEISVCRRYYFMEPVK